MSENEMLDVTLEIRVSEKEYFCQAEVRETGEILQITKESLVAFAQRIQSGLFSAMFIIEDSEGTILEGTILRQRIRTYIRKRMSCDYFYLNHYRPIMIGVFITWEDEGDKAEPAAAHEEV